MNRIGGNVDALIQIKNEGVKNNLGEVQQNWTNVKTVKGWLDFLNGQNNFEFNTKLQSTTHIFICDYQILKNITSENSRMIINDSVFEILLIDDPMNMNYQLEILLKYLGCGLGV